LDTFDAQMRVQNR